MRYSQSDSEGEDEWEQSSLQEDAAEGDISTDVDLGVDPGGQTATVTLRPRHVATNADAQIAKADGGNAAALAASPAPAREVSQPQSPQADIKQDNNADASPTSQQAVQVAEPHTTQHDQHTDDEQTEPPQPVASATPMRLLTDMYSFATQRAPHTDQGDTSRASATQISGLDNYVRASRLLTEQAQQVEVLEQRLLAAAAARDRAEAALAEQADLLQMTETRLRSAHDMELQRLKAEYEATSSRHARDMTAARAQVERLEQQLRLATAGDQAKAKPALGKSTDVSAAGAATNAASQNSELSTLKQELSKALLRESELEHLLAGYQQENEAAVRRIKDLEAALKEASTSSRAAPVVLMHDVPATRASTKEAAARLSEVLALQQQLEGVREQAAGREAELREQLDRLRAEKRELEARKGGVDLQANKEGDQLVRAVRAEMETMRSQYQAVVSELQAKLKWYVDNQQLLSTSDKLVREQQATIAMLEERLAAYEGPEGKTALQRVSDLQAQVAALQAALKARGLPKSLAAVIEAAKPSAEQSSQVVALQRQVDQLTDKLAAKDEEYEVALRSYQQQYQTLRAQFEERQSALQAQLRGRKKETQLAAQVEEQRAMYTRQIKELRTKLQQAQAQAAQGRLSDSMQGVNVGLGGEGFTSAALHAKTAELARLKEELQRKTKQVAELHLKLGEVEAKVVRLGQQAGGGMLHSLPGTPLMASPVRSSYQHTPGVHSQQPHQQSDFGGNEVGGVLVQQLQQQNAALTTQLVSMRQQLAIVQQHLLSSSVEGWPKAAASAADVEAVRRRADAAEMALASVQKAHTEAVERAALLTAEHQRALLRMQEEVAHTEATRWRERLSAAEAEMQAARGRAAAAEAELASLKQRQSGGWSPQAAEFAALEHRLEVMSTEAAAREAKWREVLEDTRQLYAVQAELAAKKWEAGMAAKNTELEGLKGRVDDLLTAAARLQQQQRSS